MFQRQVRSINILMLYGSVRQDISYAETSTINVQTYTNILWIFFYCAMSYGHRSRETRRCFTEAQLKAVRIFCYSNGAKKILVPT